MLRFRKLQRGSFVAGARQEAVTNGETALKATERFVPVAFAIGAAGQTAASALPDELDIVTQGDAWRVAGMLPTQLPPT